jgi:hypothetical protein
MFVPNLALGDGGIVQLHETRGPFSVTVFVSPEAAAGGLTDVSVLVQWGRNGEVVLDADVKLTLAPPESRTLGEAEPLCGLSSSVGTTRHSMTVQATREQASNKLLYAAPVELDTAGDWHLHVRVSRGSDKAQFDSLVPGNQASAKISGLLPFLAIPPIGILAFAMNQKLRQKTLEKG